MTIDLDPLAAQRGIDLDKLKVRYPALHKIVARETGQTTGIHALDLSLFQEASHKYLLECAERVPGLVVPAEPQIDMARLEREEQAAIQKAADEAAGRNRLEQYAQERGLEDTQANAAAIGQWLQENVKGYVSEKGVDLAVQWLGPRAKNVLTWRKPEAPPAPTPEPQEPAEVLGALPDGTTQLQLDVDNRTLSKASKDQAGDWLKRVREQQPYIRPHGAFGSKFI